MCGIAGFFNLDRAPADAGVLERMTSLQRHRGPGHHGMYLCSLARGELVELHDDAPWPDGDWDGGLGFNRLSILDPSPRGHQPMLNDARNVMIAYNGEVYNALGYTRELEQNGFRFRSRTD